MSAASFGPCVVCQSASTRCCPLCKTLPYCTAQHQFSDWLDQHKDYCTFSAVTEYDVDSLMTLPRDKLRQVASHFLERARESGDEADLRGALASSAAGLREVTRNNGGAFTQDSLPECLLLANVLGDLRDSEGAAHLLGSCAAAVAREPFDDEERTLAVLDYCANEAVGLGDVRTAAAIRSAHHDRLVRARGAASLDAATSAMTLAQLHAAAHDFPAALQAWRAASAVQVARLDPTVPEQREQLMHGIKVGSMLSYLTKQWGPAAALASRGADLARFSLQQQQKAGRGGGEAAKQAQLAVAQFSLIAGDALRHSGDLEGSLSLLDAAYKGRLTVLGDAHPETIAARKSMNRVRRSLGQPLVAGPGQKSRGSDSGGGGGGAADTLQSLFGGGGGSGDGGAGGSGFGGGSSGNGNATPLAATAAGLPVSGDPSSGNAGYEPSADENDGGGGGGGGGATGRRRRQESSGGGGGGGGYGDDGDGEGSFDDDAGDSMESFDEGFDGDDAAFDGDDAMIDDGYDDAGGFDGGGAGFGPTSGAAGRSGRQPVALRRGGGGSQRGGGGGGGAGQDGSAGPSMDEDSYDSGGGGPQQWGHSGGPRRGSQLSGNDGSVEFGQSILHRHDSSRDAPRHNDAQDASAFYTAQLARLRAVTAPGTVHQVITVPTGTPQIDYNSLVNAFGGDAEALRRAQFKSTINRFELGAAQQKQRQAAEQQLLQRQASQQRPVSFGHSGSSGRGVGGGVGGGGGGMNDGPGISADDADLEVYEGGMNDVLGDWEGGGAGGSRGGVGGGGRGGGSGASPSPSSGGDLSSAQLSALLNAQYVLGGGFGDGGGGGDEGGPTGTHLDGTGGLEAVVRRAQMLAAQGASRAAYASATARRHVQQLSGGPGGGSVLSQASYIGGPGSDMEGPVASGGASDYGQPQFDEGSGFNQEGPPEGPRGSYADGDGGPEPDMDLVGGGGWGDDVGPGGEGEFGPGSSMGGPAVVSKPQVRSRVVALGRRRGAGAGAATAAPGGPQPGLTPRPPPFPRRKRGAAPQEPPPAANAEGPPGSFENWGGGAYDGGGGGGEGFGPAAITVDAEGVEVSVPEWSEYLGDGSGSGWYGSRSGGGGGGGQPRFAADTIARRYGLGFAALDAGAAVAGGGGSELGGYGDGSAVAGAEGSLPPPDVLENPASMLGYLGKVTDRLAEAMGRMAAAAEAARSGGGAARWQGDGTLAVDTEGTLALAGKESSAVGLQHALRDAVRALGVSAADGTLGDPEAAALREALFSLVGDVGRQVSDVLQGAGINASKLAALTAWADSGGGGTLLQGSSPLEHADDARRVSQRAQAHAIRMQQQIEAAAQLPPDQAKAALMAAGMTPLQAHTALASHAASRAGGGGANAGGAYRPFDDPNAAMPAAAKMQPGLVRPEDNPSGRRMRAVFMGAEDIVGTLQTRLMALAMFRSLGTRLRRARTGDKLLFLGLCIQSVRRRAESRRATKTFAAGLLNCTLLKMRARGRLAMQLLVLGAMRSWFRVRQRAIRATKALVAGMCLKAHYKHRIGYFTAAMFALALGPMMLRTGGNPQPYKYGQKPPARKGPAKQVRSVHWQALPDIRGTVWATKRSDIAALKKLFPDMKNVFTVKPVEKAPKAGAAGGEGGEDASKPKKAELIKFIGDTKRSQNMGIAISKFKTLEGFKAHGWKHVRDALSAMDMDALLGQDGVDMLATYKPEPAELASIKDLKEEDAARLAWSESFLYEVSKVPLLSERLESMKARGEFNSFFADTSKMVEVFSLGVKEILTSKRLVEFLVDVVRPFGNELSRGAGKKEITGTAISSLVMLNQVKTADNKMTALAYIVSVLDKHRPGLLRLVDDFPMTQAASKQSYQAMKANLGNLAKYMRTITNSMAAARKLGDQTFIDVIGPFEEEASARLAQLEEQNTQLAAGIDKLCVYLGAIPEERKAGEKYEPLDKPEEVFATWWGFIEELRKVLSDYRLAQERAARQARKEAAEAEAKAAKAAKAAAAAARAGAR